MSKITKLEWVLALVIATTISVVGWLWLSPGANYFTATVVVVDHVEGSNPVVAYRRAIHRTQQMWWNVEIRPYPEGSKAVEYCRGSGNNLYSKSESKSLPLPLNEYAGVAECSPPPGRYVMHTCWQFFIGPFSKQFCAQSNVFKVKPKE